MATRNPQRVIRECDMILNGDLQQTPEQFQRWVVVQIKKLACQSAARKVEHQQLQNKVRQDGSTGTEFDVNILATGGLGLK